MTIRPMAGGDLTGSPLKVGGRKLWSPRIARPTLTRLITLADIVFAGLDEAQLLLDTTCNDPAELAQRLSTLGPAEVILKEGKRGCSALIEGVAHHAPAVPVTVIDPVGAGDAFEASAA